VKEEAFRNFDTPSYSYRLAAFETVARPTHWTPRPTHWTQGSILFLLLFIIELSGGIIELSGGEIWNQ
jgi:hypothetical protein